MVRYTPSWLALLAAIPALAKRQSILVGFSSEAVLDAVLERVTPTGAGAAGSPGNGGEPKASMFRRPLNVAGKAKGRVPGRKLPGNMPGSIESEPEMTIGYVAVDFTDADGLPIYTDHANIAEEIEALNMMPGVTIAELNGEVKELGVPDAKDRKKGKGSLRGQMERVLAESQPWGIGMVNITQFWAGGSQEVTPQKEVKICIIDTGYDLGHEDLPKTSDGVTGFAPLFYDGVWDVDGDGHGTHVAGTIGAIGSNNLGVVGVIPDSSKFTFRIGKGLEDDGYGSNAGIIDCIEDCVTSGADVISMSLGSSGPSALEESACEAAYEDGVLVIAAAGNSGAETYWYPASYPVVVSVASVAEGNGPESDTYGELSYFSTFNDQLEIAAPGSDVVSTTPFNNYESYSGTSMATPHVSAVAAWLISHFPNCESNQIRNAMLNSSREPAPRTADGWDKYFGYGIVDAGAAYSLLSSAGCEGAGGQSSSDAGMTPSAMAQGGAYQKDIGCTVNDHCYAGPSFGERYCNTDTNRCAIVPGTAPSPSPTAAPTPFAPCVGTDVKITVEFKTDDYPSESSWTISQTCGSGFSKSSPALSDAGTVKFDNFCTSDGAFALTINDSHGDGLFDPGYYKVYKDDVVMISEGPPVNFANTYTKSFGSCDGTPPTTPPPAPVTLNPTTPASVTPSPTNQLTVNPTYASTNNPTDQPSPAPVLITVNPTSGSLCGGDKELKVDVTTDTFPSETSYVIRDVCGDGNEIHKKDDFDLPESSYSETYCVPDGEYEFEIFDSYGDGVCCDYGSGSYTIFMDGEIKAEGGNFGGSEKTSFGSCGGNSTPSPTTPLSTSNPTILPTDNPTTANPSKNPTSPPSSNPTAIPTTANPSKNPTSLPTTPEPTKNPTIEPTPSPSTKPTNAPTASESTGQPSLPPVTAAEATIRVELLLDEYPGETFWSIIDSCRGGGEVVASGGSYTGEGEAVSVEVIVPRSRFIMNIMDTYGDGICCNHGQGMYEVFMDDSLVVSGGIFDVSESQFFGDCSDGPQTSKPTGEPTSTSFDSLSPSALPPSSDAPASFDDSVGTPACDNIQSICSTVGTNLLDAKSGLGEQNPSNSLDSCTDGAAGSYLVDETVESVTVVATDPTGNPVEGVLTAGGYAKIKAVVHTWNDGASSFVDFFKMSDLGSLTWEPLNNGLSPVGEGGFVEVGSPAFQLSSAGTQAVRVGIRFEGVQSSQFVGCSQGDFDEIDDLVFEVDTTTAPDTVMVALAPSVSASPAKLEIKSQETIDCSLLGKAKCLLATSCNWKRRNLFDEAVCRASW